MSFSSEGEAMASDRKSGWQSLLAWGRASSEASPEPSRSVQAERSSATANPGLAMLLAVVASTSILSSAGMLFAQSSTGQNPPGEPEGVTSGGYLMHSSVEMGYRFNARTGSNDMYDTLVNLQTGPRFLDETLSMQSLDHQGLLFDDLNLNSFGWGGDPSNSLRLRADKNKWYNFQGSFRRDQSFFDYDLLVNPLNPPSSTPSIPALNSAHAFDTRRRMTDVDLTLLPQSRVSFRLGYAHNNMTGPSFTSIHTGTDALLFQPSNTTMNSYRLGLDWRVAPRTVLSYDQFFDYYRGDTDAQLASFAPALLPGGAPVELGLAIDTGNKAPCAVKPPATSLINSTGTLTDLNCNAYFSYSRDQRIRTFTPTERLSLRSNYFQRVDLVASFSYSAADLNTPLNESFNGLETRTMTRAYVVAGPASASRISDVLDLGATVHLTKHVRLIEKFYFWAFRIPQNANFTETDSVCTGACTLLTPLSATAPATSNTSTQASFNQTWKRNQTEVAWDISKKVGVRVGYRYGDQVFNHFNDFLPGDEDHIVVHENTALLGFWARPSSRLRLNFDLERVNYDNVIVRMAPRKESRYRLQTSYTPRPWAVLGASVNILQDANADSLTNYVGHNRNYGFTASLTPGERFGMDLAYNYNDVIQNALICFNDTPPLGVSLPFVNNAASCAANDPENPLLANSFYTNHTNFAMATFRVKPVRRVTANLGYSITSVGGSIPQFNFLQPLGSSAYKYYQPVASLSVDLGHRLAWNNAWNYYQYNEGSFVGPTAPRYFHANTLTESLRYAF
jgi:hypothetical protein